MGEHPIPLDAPLEVDPDLTVADTIADASSDTPEETMCKAELDRLVAQWLAGMPDKQRYVIERRFGLAEPEMATLHELARDLGLSSERVRQIQVEALETLAQRLREKGMKKEWLL